MKEKLVSTIPPFNLKIQNWKVLEKTCMLNICFVQSTGAACWIYVLYNRRGLHVEYVLYNRRGQFSGTHVLIRSFETFYRLHLFYIHKIKLHNLVPKYDKDSDPQRAEFTRREVKLEIFLRLKIYFGFRY